MSNNQSNLGWPGLIAPKDASKKGSGTEITLWEAPAGGYVRGSVVQGVKTSITEVAADAWNAPNGSNMNAGITTASDDAVLAVVTGDGPYLNGSSAPVQVDGDTYARVSFTAGTYTEGWALYADEDHDYLIEDTAVATIGRKCAILRQTVVVASTTTLLVRVIFQGLPPFL